jgi:carboxypeptidase C (cathepsin A)
VNVNATVNRNLFYWFTEATAVDPATAPLVLWTNGGPGCSSLGGGLFSELGPFYPNPAAPGTLMPNPFTWATVANVIFLEHPAGVGFSFSNDPADLTVGDARDAADNYAFLVGFLARYPQYAKSPFYITGEVSRAAAAGGADAVVVD